MAPFPAPNLPVDSEGALTGAILLIGAAPDCTFFRPQLSWRTSCEITNATTTRNGAILVAMVPLQWIQVLQKWLISMPTDSRSIVAIYSSYRWQLDIGFRQGQVFVRYGRKIPSIPRFNFSILLHD